MLFELIRVAIGSQDCFSRIPSESEWNSLYEQAVKQSLVGVSFAGLQRLGANADDGFARIGISEMLYLTWMGMAAKIQQKNEIVNQQCAELQAKLFADGFRSYIMKGQGVAQLYGEHLSVLRQSGDIDVFIEGGLDKVLAYARTFGETTKVNELEMSVNVFPDTDVEFHYRPFIMRNPFRNAKLQAFFKDCEEENFINKICLTTLAYTDRTICVPITKFNLVHQMVHIYHHLFTEGIGMRQLMDYYFVLRSVERENDSIEIIECVKVVVHDLGLNRFASALMWVLGYVFGMPERLMLWTSDEKDGRFLLNEIMLSGNFGKLDERQKGLYDSKWNSFWIVNGKAFRLTRFDRGMWFCGPLWRIYHFVWRKIKGYE